MQRMPHTSGAAIIPFPVRRRFAEQAGPRDRWSEMEREAGEACAAASGVWYHEAALREDDRRHDA